MKRRKRSSDVDIGIILPDAYKQKDELLPNAYKFKDELLPNAYILDSKNNVVRQGKTMQTDVSRMLANTKKKNYNEAVGEDKLAIEEGLKIAPKLQGLKRQKTSQENLTTSRKGYNEMKRMKRRSSKQSKYEQKAEDIAGEMND